MHVYKLINLCTCVCRSYTSGCRQNAEGEEGEEKKGGGGKGGEKTGERGLEEGSWGRREKGEEKRSEEEENTWIYFKTRLYTRVRPIQKEGASKVREERKRERQREKGLKRTDVERTEKKRIPVGQKHRKQKETKRVTDKHLWMKGENEREGRQRAETLLKLNSKLESLYVR